LRREEEVEDTFDGRGHDSEEEEEQEPKQEEEQHEEGTMKGRPGTTKLRWWGVTDLL
jgi:hypothetical protein